MSIIKTELNPKIYLELTEGEAGCLDAICGYGHEDFLKVFKEKLGSHYIERNGYEDHIKSLFDKARKLHMAINELKEAYKNIHIINC